MIPFQLATEGTVSGQWIGILKGHLPQVQDPPAMTTLDPLQMHSSLDLIQFCQKT